MKDSLREVFNRLQGCWVEGSTSLQTEMTERWRRTSVEAYNRPKLKCSFKYWRIMVTCAMLGLWILPDAPQGNFPHLAK